MTTTRRIADYLRALLCRVGWHQSIGLTTGGFIRCYACSRNLHPQDNTWRYELPPELRPAEEIEAERLRAALEDLVTACWNDDMCPQPAHGMAMEALGYRRVGGTWRRP